MRTLKSYAWADMFVLFAYLRYFDAPLLSQENLYYDQPLSKNYLNEAWIVLFEIEFIRLSYFSINAIRILAFNHKISLVFPKNSLFYIYLKFTFYNFKT